MSNNDPSFQECIKESNNNSRNLLLGNGFSIGLHNDFSQPEFIKFSNEHMIQLFNLFKTSDFEKVMESILNTKDILRCLEPEIGKMFDTEKHIEIIKKQFLETIKNIHPKNRNEIIDRIPITKPFINSFENIFTLNYDLMLYWIIMELKKDPLKKIYPDGFRRKDELLLWTRPDEQKLFYLHGALHFHTSNMLGITVKNSFKGTDKPLINQLRENLTKGEWPMIVLEGTSKQKLKAIYEKPYLDFSLKFLKTIQGCLFIHGCSFKEQDAHIYDTIFSNSNLTKICIGRLEDDMILEGNITSRIANRSNILDKIVYYNAHTIYELSK